MAEFKHSWVNIRFGDNSNIRFFIKHIPGLNLKIFFESNEVRWKGRTADLYYDPHNQLIYKFFLAKKKKNFFLYFLLKRLWEIPKHIAGYSPAKREFMGNRLLHRYGFNVPEPLGIGFTFSAAANYRCLLVIKNIPESATLMEILEAGAPPDRLEIIRKRIINAIDRMITSRIRFRDFHVANILIDSENTIYWIDTRADKFYFQILYRKAKTRMLKLFIYSFTKVHNGPQGHIDEFIRSVRSLIQ